MGDSMMDVQAYESRPVAPEQVRAFRFTGQTWAEIYTALGWNRAEMGTFGDDPQDSPEVFEVSLNAGAHGRYLWVDRGDYVILSADGSEILDVLKPEAFERRYQPSDANKLVTV